MNFRKVNTRHVVVALAVALLVYFMFFNTTSEGMDQKPLGVVGGSSKKKALLDAMRKKRAAQAKKAKMAMKAVKAQMPPQQPRLARNQ